MAKNTTVEILDFLDNTGIAVNVYEMALDFSKKYVAPVNASLDETNTFPAHLWKEMGRHGLLGLQLPEIYGGSNTGFMAAVAAVEAISYHSGSVALSQLAHVDLCMGRIAKHGNDEQKARYLPGLISGELVGALAMSEPDAGSDVMSMTTRLDGNILNGQKTWITNGGKADVVVTYAKSGERSLTAFLVNKEMDGFIAGAKLNKTGMRGSETYPLYFDNCFIPEENILGQRDKGSHILMDGLNTERITLAAAAVGLAENSLDIALQYTGERKQFGKPLHANQSVAFDLADMSSKLQAVKNHVYLSAAMYDNNPSSLTNARAASVYLEAGRMGEDVTARALKLCGGMGYTKDMPLYQNWNDMMLYQIGGGTEKVRQLILARELING